MFYYRDRNYRRNMPPPNHMYTNQHNMSQADDNSPAEDIQEDKQNEKMQQEHIHETQVADNNTQAEVDGDLIEEAIEEQEHKVCDENNASAEPVSKANSDTKKESVDEAEALFDPINDLLGIYKMMVKTKKSKK